MNRFVTFVAACFWVVNAWAYEIETHADMSANAARSSVLADTNFLRSLGLQYPIDAEQQKYPDSNGTSKTILNLIRDGAKFEDNLLLGSFLRVRHHFYDPLYNRPLTVLGIAAGEKSPDWALEDLSIVGGQDYSYKDARNYLYQALTATKENDRNKNFGLIFQTLGHVIHHIQDMAQPQHVRNDIHPSVGSHKSLYEEYTYVNRGQLLYAGYNAVTFPKARSFWTTGDGKGLAEFTNRNFVSAGANYQLRNGQVVANATYPQPVPLAGESIHIRDLLKEEGRTTDLDGYVDFVANTVTDALTGETKLNPRSASVSIFDQDLKTYNKTVTYDTSDSLDPSFNIQVTTDRALTLNRFNFKKAHEFLIPRAVAYSTGLLDYFFRGKLEAQDAGFTDTGISLRVKNAIDPKALPAWRDETMSRRRA